MQVKRLLTVLLVLFCCGLLRAKSVVRQDSLQLLATKQYQALVKELAAGDTTVDLGEMRLAYAGSEFYHPYGDENGELCRQGDEALTSFKPSMALRFYREALMSCYCLPKAHYGAQLSSRFLGNDSLARFHQGVLSGILESILDGRDGQSPASAYIVIGNWEEFFLFNECGYEPLGQGVISHEERIYDRWVVEEKAAGVTDTLYFDINIQFDWMLNRMAVAKLLRCNQQTWNGSTTGRRDNVGKDQ